MALSTAAANSLTHTVTQVFNNVVTWIEGWFRRDDGPALPEGVARDRMPAIHDPEVRHGRKSKRKRFDGHKAQLVVDTRNATKGIKSEKIVRC